MNFFDAFLDELDKLGFEIEAGPEPPEDSPPPSAPDPPDGAQELGNETPPPSDVGPVPETPLAERLLDEGRAEAVDEGAVGGFGSMETRDHTVDLLKSMEGRQEIRKTLASLTRQANKVIQSKRALTRNLLRARREIFGPSPNPRQDLINYLYGGEPFHEATYA